MKKLSRTVEREKTRICEWLMEMVRIPTVNPPGKHYSEIVGWLDDRCRQLGLKTRIVPVPDSKTVGVLPDAENYPRVNLIAQWDVGAERTVHFNAHFDVVPASGGWRSDPFHPEISGNWLYGRGANDMKDSIAALLSAIAALRENGIQPAFNIECSFTCDEETGGELGAGYIARNGLVHADYVVNCEGGRVLDVGVGHNGVLWLDVTVHGKSAHASRPEKGLNAFEKIAELTETLKSVKQNLASSTRTYTTPGGAKRQPTMSIGGVFRGSEGDKINTIPARASFTIDRRILPNERLKAAEGEIRNAIQAFSRSNSKLEVDVETVLGIPPCMVPPSHPFPKAFAKAVRAVRRHPARFSTARGFTDLHFFVEDCGLPGIGYGPRGEGAHGANERVNIPDLVQTAKIYARFMATPLDIE